MGKRLAIVAIVVVLVAAGCSGGSSDGAKSGADTENFSTTSSAPKTTTTTRESTATTADDTSDTTDPDDDDTSGPSEGSSPTPCGEASGPGVADTHCDGTASIIFEIDGEGGTIEGGECRFEDEDHMELVAGTETDEDEFEGSPPDFAGIQVPKTTGEFDDGIVAVTWNGESEFLLYAEGTHDGKKGTFEGEMLDGRTLSGSFSC